MSDFECLHKGPLCVVCRGYDLCYADKKGSENEGTQNEDTASHVGSVRTSADAMQDGKV